MSCEKFPRSINGACNIQKYLSTTSEISVERYLSSTAGLIIRSGLTDDRYRFATMDIKIACLTQEQDKPLRYGHADR